MEETKIRRVAPLVLCFMQLCSSIAAYITVTQRFSTVTYFLIFWTAVGLSPILILLLIRRFIVFLAIMAAPILAIFCGRIYYGVRFLEAGYVSPQGDWAIWLNHLFGAISAIALVVWILVRASMWISLRFRPFFLALYRTIQVLMERVTSEDKNYQRIELTDRDYGLYLRFPSPRFQLGDNLGESSSADLSLDDVRAFLGLIADACEKQEVSRAKIGPLSVKIDARPNPKHPDRLIVRFSQPLGLWTVLSRRQVMSAREEFLIIFGQESTRPSGVNFDGGGLLEREIAK